MFSLSLKHLPILSMAFASVGAVANAQELLNPVPHNGTNVVEASQNQRIDYVDMHTVLLIDSSGSVDPYEEELMFESIYHALTSDNGTQHFGGGISRAITIVNYANNAKASKTFIINSPEEAIAFAQNFIFDPETRKIKYSMPDAGTKTFMSTGLTETANIFETEAQIGIHSLNKSVVVFADDPTEYADRDNVLALSRQISSRYGAVFFGVPITRSGRVAGPPTGKAAVMAELPVSDFFNNYVITPKGMTYTDPYGFKMPLRAGASNPASKPADAEPIIHMALNLAGT